MKFLYDGDCPRFGMRADTTQPITITNLPAGVLKVRIRERCDNFTRVFLKFADRIECWNVKEDGDMNHWRLAELDFNAGCNQTLKKETSGLAIARAPGCDPEEMKLEIELYWIDIAAARICSASWVLQDCEVPIACIIREVFRREKKKQISAQAQKGTSGLAT